jgi:hypothetical protein
VSLLAGRAKDLFQYARIVGSPLTTLDDVDIELRHDDFDAQLSQLPRCRTRLPIGFIAKLSVVWHRPSMASPHVPMPFSSCPLRCAAFITAAQTNRELLTARPSTGKA